MRIIETLSAEEAAAAAVIEVEEHEVADIDEMLTLVARFGADYALNVRLVSTDDRPKIKNIGEHQFAMQRRGLSEPAMVRDHKRYYEVHVRRLAMRAAG